MGRLAEEEGVEDWDLGYHTEGVEPKEECQLE